MSMTQESVMKIVLEALSNLNKERETGHEIPVSPQTALFGKDSLLDSLALVSVIVDVETAVSDELGEPISLTSDDALNRDESPFANVRSLCAYILHLSEGKG